MKTINRIIPIILGAALILITACSKEQKDLPAASFKCPNTVGVGDTIYFQNTSEGANTFDWDFGDGNVSTEENPSHIYTEPGVFTILLVAANEDGSNEASWDILIKPWATRAHMPTARYSMGTAVVDGKIYAIGGLQSETIPLSVVEVYDPVTNSWETKTPMPTARGAIGCAVVDGKIYAIGGGLSRPNPLSIVEVYDPVTDSWDDTPKTPMPTARSDVAACTVNGKIYVIGGTLQTTYILAGTVKVEEYDPATDRWTTKKIKPTAGYGLRACVLEGKIYVTGGNVQWLNITAALEVYDPVKDEWDITKAPMPKAKYSHSICTVNKNIYSFGGWYNCSTGQFYTMAEVYNSTTDTWTRLTDIPLTLGELSAVTVYDRIFIMGGTSTLHPFTSVNNLYEYIF